MDVVTSVTAASDVASSQFVWAIVAITVTSFVIWSYSKRETILMNNQRELNSALTSQAETMKDISRSLESLERRMEYLERKADK